MLTIRNETPADRQTVEDITRRAFYNLYAPGCVEHYLVHIMRDHPDFIPELDLVAELENKIFYGQGKFPGLLCDILTHFINLCTSWCCEPQTGQAYKKYLSQIDTSDVRKLEQVD